MAFCVNAQECTLSISGRISGIDGQPLEGATITLLPGRASAAAGANGNFDFHGQCPGRYLITIRYVGYKTMTDSIDLVRPHYREFQLTSNSILETIVIHEDQEEEATAQVVTTLKRPQLDALAGKSLGESLREISGVNSIQAGPGIFKPVIHGVHSQRILILNHGVRQEGQQWGAEHAPEIDPLIANDIQVIKDASAIRYGVDAIGGVVVVNPPALPESPGLGGHVQMIGQSNGRGGTISGSLQGGMSRKPGWGWRLQGTRKRLGDHQSATYTLSNTGLCETSFSGAAGYHHERGGIDVFASRFSTIIGILKGTSIGNLEDLSRVIGAEIPDQTKPFSYSIGEPRQEVVHSLVRIRGHVVLPRTTWRMQYAWQQNARKEFDIRRQSLLKLPAIDLLLNTHTMDGEWQPTTRSSDKILIGMNGMYQYNRNVPGTQRIPFIPDFITLTGGTYGVYRHSADRLTWDLGARFDVRHYSVSGFDFRNTRYRQRMNFANASATAGLTWKTGDLSSLSTSLSSAWRPPHVAELFSLGAHQSAAAIEYGLFLDPLTNEIRDAAAVNFRNEQALKWVGSWKGEWKNMKAEITTYANYIFNYFWLKPGGITRNTRGAYPYFRYDQSDALFTGLDVDMTLPLGERFTLHPRASLIRAADLTNKDFLSFIPANRADLKLHYEVPASGSIRSQFVEIKATKVFRQNRSPRTITPSEFLNAAAQGTDPFDGSPANFDFLSAPAGYFLFQASAGFSFMVNNSRYDVRVSGDNLFNTAFREYTNRFRYYADDLGRNIRLSFNITF